MNGDKMDNLYNEKDYRIRCMKNLVIQLKEDQAYCNRLWKRFKKGPGDKSEIEELVRVLSWLKKGINTFEELRKKGIEGISWGEIKKMEKDMEDKEIHIKLFLLSVSKETEYCHLR